MCNVCSTKRAKSFAAQRMSSLIEIKVVTGVILVMVLLPVLDYQTTCTVSNGAFGPSYLVLACLCLFLFCLSRCAFIAHGTAHMSPCVSACHGHTDSHLVAFCCTLRNAHRQN